MRIRNVTQEAKRAIGSVSPHLVNTGVMTYLEDDTLQRQLRHAGQRWRDEFAMLMTCNSARAVGVGSIKKR